MRFIREKKYVKSETQTVLTNDSTIIIEEKGEAKMKKLISIFVLFIVLLTIIFSLPVSAITEKDYDFKALYDEANRLAEWLTSVEDYNFENIDNSAPDDIPKKLEIRGNEFMLVSSKENLLKYLRTFFSEKLSDELMETATGKRGNLEESWFVVQKGYVYVMLHSGAGSNPVDNISDPELIYDGADKKVYRVTFDVKWVVFDDIEKHIYHYDNYTNRTFDYVVEKVNGNWVFTEYVLPDHLYKTVPELNPQTADAPVVISVAAAAAVIGLCAVVIKKVKG